MTRRSLAIALVAAAAPLAAAQQRVIDFEVGFVGSLPFGANTFFSAAGIDPASYEGFAWGDGTLAQLLIPGIADVAVFTQAFGGQIAAPSGNNCFFFGVSGSTVLRVTSLEGPVVVRGASFCGRTGNPNEPFTDPEQDVIVRGFRDGQLVAETQIDLNTMEFEFADFGFGGEPVDAFELERFDPRGFQFNFLMDDLVIGEDGPAFGGCNPADRTEDGAISFGDAIAFIDAFNAGDAANTAEDGDPGADTNGDGEITFADVTAFIDAFNLGCP